MKAKIGIMSEALVRNRMLAIASGSYQLEGDEPKIWYSSMNAICQILNEKNIELIRLIEKEKPESLTELARLTGRQKSNLSNTLKTLSDKGFLRLEKGHGNVLKPVTLYTDFEIVVDSYYENKVLKAVEEMKAA